VQGFGREIIRDVLAATDVVDIVGAAVELKTAGSGRLKGLCPFHTEKTPSFTVSRTRQAYHCFGCGKGGDAVDFLQEYEGLTFVEALRKLADRAGIRLPALSPRDNAAEEQRGRILELTKLARRHYCGELQHPLRGSLARKYLQGRQLKEETMQRFGLGFAPEGWSGLLDVAKKKGFSEPVLLGSGLFRQGERGGVYDFFRNRLMVPIHDVAGNVVAFGGRDLSGEEAAKYINSPETAVYKKARTLYGLHEARQALRKEKRALLVEGYFDALRCFDAGIENVVATCGTALTPEQAALLKRYVPEVVLVYDGDDAGIKAAIRGSGVLSAAGLTVRALVLPQGQDPDDFIQAQGTDDFLKAVEDAPDFVTFYARMSADRVTTIEGRTTVAQEVFAILRQIDDPLRVDEYLKRLATELRLNENLCRSEYHKFLRQAERAPRRWEEPEAAPEARESTAAQLIPGELHFLTALLKKPDLLREAVERLKSLTLPDGPLGEVLRVLIDTPEGAPVERMPSDAARHLYSEAAAAEWDTKAEPGDLVHQLLNQMQKNAAQSQEAERNRQVQEAEQQGDHAASVAQFAERLALVKQRQKLGPG
jgi:DNA primase